jgi:hypothetical protein
MCKSPCVFGAMGNMGHTENFIWMLKLFIQFLFLLCCLFFMSQCIFAFHKINS